MFFLKRCSLCVVVCEGVGAGHDSERYLGRPLGIEENVGLSVAHFFHTANLHLRVITVDPETWRKTKFRTDSGVSGQNLQGPRPGKEQWQ